MFIPLDICQHGAEAVGNREGPNLESDATLAALINQELSTQPANDHVRSEHWRALCFDCTATGDSEKRS